MNTYINLYIKKEIWKVRKPPWKILEFEDF